MAKTFIPIHLLETKRKPKKQNTHSPLFTDTGKGYLTFIRNPSEEESVDYWSYEKSREFIRPLLFSSRNEYYQYSFHSYVQRRWGGDNYINRNNIECPIKPVEIPDDVKRYYKDDWVDYLDFFIGPDAFKELDIYIHSSSTRHDVHSIYYSYETACKIVREIGFETIEDYIYWEKQSKKRSFSSNYFYVTLPSGKTVKTRPFFLPATPQATYDKHWVCLQEYIGLPYTFQTMCRRKKGMGQLKNIHKFKKRHLVPYTEAREFLRECKLSGPAELKKWVKHSRDNDHPFVTKLGMSLPKYPHFLPKYPNEYYIKQCKVKHTWVSWNDLLGLKYNKNHDAELEELMAKASHTFYRSFTQWVNENQIKEKGYSIHSYLGRKIRNNEWSGWGEMLNRYNSTDKCSFEDAKILLSFKNLHTVRQYNNWRKKAGSPFFLPVIHSDDHLALEYPGEANPTVSNFLSIELGDKIQTQAKASPVLAITVVKDQHILVDIVKPGKFEAFMRYINNPSCYVFDLFDKSIWNEIQRHHCEHSYGGNIFYVKHMGYLYQDLTNNFRRINLARIYD